MGLHAWSEPKPNVVYYNYPLYSPPPLSDTVVTGVDRALPHISMPPSFSDTVSLGVDRAHVHGSMSLHNSDTDVLGVGRSHLTLPNSDTVSWGVYRAHVRDPMPPLNSDTVSLGVDRAHVRGSMSLLNSDRVSSQTNGIRRGLLFFLFFFLIFFLLCLSLPSPFPPPWSTSSSSKPLVGAFGRDIRCLRGSGCSVALGVLGVGVPLIWASSSRILALLAPFPGPAADLFGTSRLPPPLFLDRSTCRPPLFWQYLTCFSLKNENPHIPVFGPLDSPPTVFRQTTRTPSHSR